MSSRRGTSRERDVPPTDRLIVPFARPDDPTGNWRANLSMRTDMEDDPKEITERPLHDLKILVVEDDYLQASISAMTLE